MHLNGIHFANYATNINKSWDHPSNPLFKELNWLPLQSRITYDVALLFFLNTY